MPTNDTRDLGDGLVLRRATPDDAEPLVAFHAAVHADAGPGSPDDWVGAWVRDLMSGRHPTFRPGDFTVVEETGTGDIVSSLCLISQTWSCDGIPFGFGRPELVGTRPDYRRRGLIRAQMDLVHEWSAERGEMVQGITGIPNYYRQFGYEMALELGGGRAGYAPHVPKLAEGCAEPFRLRPAAEADLPAIGRLYEAGCGRSLVSCLHSEALWRYEIAIASAKNVNRRDLVMIESAGGERVGFLAHWSSPWHGVIGAAAYELEPGVSWLAVTPSVVRYLWKTAEEAAAREGTTAVHAFAFYLGTEHPAYRAFETRLPRTHTPYAWYLRVPDLPGFVRHIAPALEARLAASVAPGYSGEMRLSFYREGLRMAWEKGRLASAEKWDPASGEDGQAAFPGLTFLQLVFGYRDLSELRHAFPDCWTAGDEVPVVLAALFPKHFSNVWPVV